MAKAKRKQFGQLAPKYNYSLNPYPNLKFSKCPICENKTGQRKRPLLIHVDPMHLISLNYSNRYCFNCDLLIGHKHEIEHHLTQTFSQLMPQDIGNNYLIMGTVEKKSLTCWVETTTIFWWNNTKSSRFQKLRRTTDDCGWLVSQRSRSSCYDTTIIHWMEKRIFMTEYFTINQRVNIIFFPDINSETYWK